MTNGAVEMRYQGSKVRRKSVHMLKICNVGGSRKKTRDVGSRIGGFSEMKMDVKKMAWLSS